MTVVNVAEADATTIEVACDCGFLNDLPMALDRERQPSQQPPPP